MISGAAGLSELASTSHKLHALTLDPITAIDDPTFAARIALNTNMPDAIKVAFERP